ncbi:hypothetical protein FHG87_019428 [Trinorchestia longiramus]|nr:hypothetical protein FHG87_019428 [Trinorchestia longiramus]
MVSDSASILSSSYSESSLSYFCNNVEDRKLSAFSGIASPTLGRLRRSNHRTNSCSFSDLLETVEIRGRATLCFDEEGTHFEGVIVADDRSLYSIHGKKSPRRKNSKDTSSCRCGDSKDGGPLLSETPEQGVPVSFDIRIKDHDNPKEYQLRRVHGMNGQTCKFACDNISFSSVEVYRGHKADMIAQECLGHRIEGGKSQVFRGPFSAQVQAKEEPRHWVL